MTETSPETLAERAHRQEGPAIPEGKAVRVELRDAYHQLTEGKDFSARDSAADLGRFVSEFIVAAVAEGEPGTCEWYLVDINEPWEV